MNIEWEAQDGYCGGSRPQEFEMSDDDIANCETVEEAMRLIDESTEIEFRNTVTWNYTNRDEFKAEIEHLIEERKKNEAEENEE